MNRWVRREVTEQLRGNPVARRVRYGLVHRALRRFFGSGTFGRFIIAYMAVNVAVVAAEALSVWLVPAWLPAWSTSGSAPATDIKALMLNVSSCLLGAQIGLLGVISLSLALVTLIAQREGSSTDVQVYYHESFSFELVASCVALAAVLCAQLLWPLQFFIHRLGLGTELQFFKLCLLGLHLAWLLVNLAAVAYFIATTFRFVQQSARETLRERYTANVVLPRDLTQRLREQLYGLATKELIGDDEEDRGRPTATFGFDFGAPWNVEVETLFARPVALHDVRMTWVRWVLKRWSARCVTAAAQQPTSASHGLGRMGPSIWFTPHIGGVLRGNVSWCRRREGVPLTAFEKFVLRRAFIFRSSRDEG
ncbi:hypothetical protein GCM10007301_56760 [Azorhizobium oxalatiphilum]|uniref:Uncharacterized protein n=1 Tax=Azorhizobium oxalatiphilum TaxID=980631 RepID=A0A917CID1_9HYPH|nr:hypothetical protein [Azorhizobium oxalatiphilum]GGF89487.1 hypothetical protein GCM10007301_56760 [Azorhizobium oxalatiphilum]